MNDERSSITPESDETAQYRQCGAAIYADASDDTIEVDDGAPVVVNKDGAWVAAWVWVAAADLEV